jgi:hypothetical protein
MECMYGRGSCQECIYGARQQPDVSRSRSRVLDAEDNRLVCQAVYRATTLFLSKLSKPSFVLPKGKPFPAAVQRFCHRDPVTEPS